MRNTPSFLRNALFVVGLVAVLAAPFMVTTLAQGQADEHQVTVLKRDGTRVSGRLEALGDGYVWVRASQADQQKLPLGDVLVVDFVAGASGLPETELSHARGAEHVLVLRDSSIVKGRLLGMQGGLGSGGGDTKRVASFQETGSGQTRTVEADRIGRIYLGNYSKATTESAQAAKSEQTADVPGGAIRVPANQEWTATPVTVREGERITFSVTGQITLSATEGDAAGAAGSLKARTAANAPLPANYAGCLIARIGNSKPFAIGDISTPIPMPASGQLYLGINDDDVADNRGEFYVTLSRGGQSR